MRYKVIFLIGGRFIRPEIVADSDKAILKALRDAQCLPGGKFDVSHDNGMIYVSKGDKRLFELSLI